MSVIPDDFENTTENPTCMIRRKIYFSESFNNQALSCFAKQCNHI